MKKVYSFLKIFTVLLVLVLITAIVNAQKTATATGPWSSNATWGGAAPPTATDAVTINNAVTVTVDVAAACSSITFAGASATASAINVNAGITLNVTTSITLQNSATINTAAAIGGAGTINCASVSVGGTVAPTDNATHTTILNSTISNLSLTGNLTLTGQHTTALRRNAPTFNLGSGNVTIGGTAVLTAPNAPSAATLTLAFAPQSGTLTLLGATPITITNSNFIANGTSATVNYSGGTQTISPVTYNNLTLSGSGTKTITGSTINGTLSRQGTATTAGTLPTYGAAAILEYKGSAAQTISDVEFGGTGANPANVTIDNINGVTLSTAKSINGVLALVNGYLTTTGLFTINAAGNATTANGAFVNGPLAKAKNTTTLFTFPVGNLVGGLRTIGVTPQTTAATTYRASFLSANPRAVPNGTNLGAISQISGCEYWDLAQTTGATPARVTVSWPAAANSCGNGTYVSDLPTLIVAHHNGANWINEGQSGTTGDAVNGGTVTSANFVGTFSPFTLGTTDASLNPLPVLFADVKAYEKNNGIQIEWSNLTERDLVNYVVERSATGQNFAAISQQLPRSNQNDKESYTSFDASPFAGANFYRIKVQEISGKVIYSKILKVTIGGAGKGFTLYPNPVKGNQLTVGINAKQGQYTLTVMSTGGQKVFTQKLMHQGGNMSQAIELPATVKPGAYNMTISGDNYREAKMFIVQ